MKVSTKTRKSTKEPSKMMKSTMEGYFTTAIRINSWLLPEDTRKTILQPQDINVVGMRQAFGKGTRLPVRVFWVVILACLFAIVLTQVTNRVCYYLSNPVKVTMRIKRMSSMTFPAITLCYKNKHINSERAASNNMEEAEASLQKSQQELPDMLTECFFGRNKPCFTKGQFILRTTILGLCYTYVLNENVSSSGPFNNLFMKLKDLPNSHKEDSGWKLLVHHPQDNVAIRVLTDGSSVYQYWNPDVKVSMKEFKMLNTYGYPCVDRANYSDVDCELMCLQDVVAAEGGCRLGFMVPGSLPTCHTFDDHNRTLQLVIKLVQDGEWSRSGCGCDAPCTDVTYEVYSDSRQSENTTKIKVYYQELTFQEVVEEWAYTLIPLMGDVGGVMGLLLGASVLTFIEVLECMLGCWYYRGCRHRATTATTPPQTPRHHVTTTPASKH